MFGFEWITAVQIASGLANLAEEQYFEESIKNFPLDVQTSARAKRAQEKEKARLEAIEERRHQEMCEAIKQAGRNAKPDHEWHLF